MKVINKYKTHNFIRGDIVYSNWEISKDVIIGYTFKHKVRLWIWIVWSMMKWNKEYYFYWIHCSNYKFYTKKYNFIIQWYYSCKHKLLRKLTPLLNKVL